MIKKNHNRKQNMYGYLKNIFRTFEAKIPKIFKNIQPRPKNKTFLYKKKSVIILPTSEGWKVESTLAERKLHRIINTRPEPGIEPET